MAKPPIMTKITIDYLNYMCQIAFDNFEGSGLGGGDNNICENFYIQKSYSYLDMREGDRVIEMD